MACKDQQAVSGGIAPVGVAIPFLTYPMIKFGLLFFSLFVTVNASPLIK
jgi:hypothetical protein